MPASRQPGRPIHQRRLACAALLLSCALGSGCGDRSAPAEVPSGAVRSAILITLDTTRADALGAYGGREGLTPALDRLADEGVLYEQARSVAPITLPAHASMLTGLYPPRHTARDNSLNPVPSTVTTLAERADELGIATGAFVGSIVLDGSFGLDQGFGHYGTPAQKRSRDRSAIGLYDERPGSEVIAEASDWLRELDSGTRFFAWVHLFDPHTPYSPPDAARERAGGNAYLGEVAATDDAVAMLVEALRELGRMDDTLIMVVGDHGEGLGEHGESTHGVFCYDSTMRIPFLIRYPDGTSAGERRSEIVSVTDVYPTLVEALALGEPGDIDGVGLYRRSVPHERGAYFESFYGTIHYGWAPLVGWVDADGKYIHGQPPERFKLDGDSDEHAIAPEQLDTNRHLNGIAAVLAADTFDAEGEIDPEMLTRLQALGYVTAGSKGGLALPDPLAASDLPNPRDRHGEAERLDRAIATLQRGEVEEAIVLFESVVAENPRNTTAIEFMAPAMIETGRASDAIPLLQQLVDSGVARALTHVNLGRCLEIDGRAEEALTQFRTAAELEPNNAIVLRMLAGLLAKLGHAEESEETLRRLTARNS